jgi:signal transduction histidine kinase
MNVFGNALKYSPSGYIYIGLKSSSSSSSSIAKKSPSEQKQGFDVIITVKDTGKGIGPKFLQSDLFSPFKQEDPFVSSSGLGLSIVRHDVRFTRGLY